MDMDMDEQYEIERIIKKKTRKNHTYYLIKWYGFAQSTWKHQSQLLYAKHHLDNFEKKLKFKNQLKSYIAEKKERIQVQQPNVIVLDSEQQAKKVICIISSQDQAERQNQKQNTINNQQSQSQPQVVTQQHNQAVGRQQYESQESHLTPIEQPMPAISQNQIVEEKSNSQQQNLEPVQGQKVKTISITQIKQNYQMYKRLLPPLVIIRAVIRDDRKLLHFECKGKRYQISYQTMKKYRADQLVEFYQKRKDLYSTRLYDFRT